MSLSIQDQARLAAEIDTALGTTDSLTAGLTLADLIINWTQALVKQNQALTARVTTLESQVASAILKG